MKNLRNTNLLNRAEAHARHVEKLDETLLFLFHFHFSTPQIIANLLGTTTSHARIFVESLQAKELLRGYGVAVLAGHSTKHIIHLGAGCGCCQEKGFTWRKRH